MGGVPDRIYEGGGRREIGGIRHEIYEANPAYYAKTHHLREKRYGKSCFPPAQTAKEARRRRPEEEGRDSEESR